MWYPPRLQSFQLLNVRNTVSIPTIKVLQQPVSDRRSTLVRRATEYTTQGYRTLLRYQQAPAYLVNFNHLTEITKKYFICGNLNT